MKPELHCVLTHYYELKPDAERDQNVAIALMDDPAKKYTAIRTMNEVARRRGFAAVKADILSSIQGQQSESEVHLPVGAGLFPDELRIETYVRQCLKHKDLRYQVAATYASVFYMGRSEEISCILSERVVLAEGWKLVVAASRDALAILADVGSAGKCSRCKDGLVRNGYDWVPLRAAERTAIGLWEPRPQRNAV